MGGSGLPDSLYPGFEQERTPSPQLLSGFISPPLAQHGLTVLLGYLTGFFLSHSR